MLTIGAFAKLCNVTAKTLRYYDDAGILKAAWVNETNGYRYYSLEQQEVLQEIQSLKRLGFSLREIKALLLMNDEQKQQALREKKQQLACSLQNMENELVKFPEEDTGNNEDCLLHIPFENCPEMVGKWEFCGVDSASSLENVTVTTIKKADNSAYPFMYFLPGGAFYRTITWSKGVVYCLSPKLKQMIANPCRLIQQSEVRYLAIQWMETSQNTQPQFWIYRQLDNKHYTAKETYAARDCVDLPFVIDEQLVGTWHTYDIISSRSAFSPNRKRTKPEDWWITKMQITRQGLCIRTFNGQKGEYRKIDSYTKGVILDKESELAMKYWIKTVSDTVYLLMEHKSGDYQFNGQIRCYYVFQKEENQ